MLDSLTLETAGIPAVVVCTAEFAPAAVAQARALGQTSYDVARVAHPMAAIPPEAVAERALQARSDIVRLLSSRP